MMKTEKSSEISDRYKLFSAKPDKEATRAKQVKSGSEYDYFFKVTLLGDYGAGKSSLLQRYVEDSFTESYIFSTGQDFKIKNIEKDGYKVQLQIWDIAGMEYKTVVSNHYKNWSVGLVVFDITNPGTFHKAIECCKTNHCNGGTCSSIKDYKLVLVGNKIDLPDERKVEYTDARAAADSLNIPYIETSAKEKINVEALFSIVCELNMPEEMIGSEPSETCSCSLF